MTASNTTTPMDIDGNTSSSIKGETPSSATKSDSTLPFSPPPYHKNQLPFLDIFPSLPPTGSSNAAHILDLLALPQDNDDQKHTIKLQDAVATTLHLLSPSTLRKFLNPTIHIFKAVFKGDDQLVIWRRGIEVLIGKFTHHPTLRAFCFSHVAGFLIGYDGSWYLKATAGNAFSSTRWNEVWRGEFECFGGVAKMSVEREEGAMEWRAGLLAREMVCGRFWEGKVEVRAS